MAAKIGLLLLFSCPVASALQALAGIKATRLSDSKELDIGAAIANEKSLLVCGTYPADFNAIEYAQRLQHYAPELKERGVESIRLVLNGPPAACEKLVELLDLEGVEVLSDPSGAAGRAFGCSRGWKPDDDKLTFGEVSVPLNAYGKLLGMLVGLGAWATLPAVISGYLGNPFRGQPWIETALAQGRKVDRWPSGLVVDLDDSGAVTRNAFAELPVVGSWPRRPLELATLRLQNMVGVSLKHWDALKPDDERVLTQLGGLVVSDGAGGSLYEYRDPGICAVCVFEDVLAALDDPAPAALDGGTPAPAP